MKNAKNRHAKQSGARLGRPRKQPEEKYRTPVLQIGRVDPGVASELRAAAKRAGETFTSWAASRLIDAARREAKKA